MNENEEPTMDDLTECAALEADVLTEEIDWESLLEPVIETRKSEWVDDDPCHDDRYDGSGIPNWSAFA